MNKFFISALFLLSFSFAAHGSVKEKTAKDRKPASMVTIEGKEAKKIYKLLEQAAAGSNPECGAGKCWFEGKIQCSEDAEGKFYCQVLGSEKN